MSEAEKASIKFFADLEARFDKILAEVQKKLA